MFGRCQGTVPIIFMQNLQLAPESYVGACIAPVIAIPASGSCYRVLIIAVSDIVNIVVRRDP